MAANRCPPHLSPSPLYWSSRSSSSTTTGINCSCWCTGWLRPSYTEVMGRFLKNTMDKTSFHFCKCSSYEIAMYIREVLSACLWLARGCCNVAGKLRQRCKATAGTNFQYRVSLCLYAHLFAGLANSLVHPLLVFHPTSCWKGDLELSF